MKGSKRVFHARISHEDLADDLRSIGLSYGDHVAIAVSLGKIGNVIGGPEAVLDSFLEVIGPDGTLMMNAISDVSIPSWLEIGNIFDPKTSVSYTGYVSEVLRLREGPVRSEHPTNSVVAFGKYADILTRGHAAGSNCLQSYFNLAKLGGKYLSIGLEDRMVSIRHAGQMVAGLYDIVPMYFCSQYRDEHGQTEVHYESYPCASNLPVIVPILERNKVIRRGNVGMADSIIGDARSIISETGRILAENPELTLCDYPWCVWCREVERKLRLYDKISEPRFFQQPFIREAVGFLNRIRIKKYQLKMYRDYWKSPAFSLPFYLYVYSKMRAQGLIISLKKKDDIVLLRYVG